MRRKHASVRRLALGAMLGLNLLVVGGVTAVDAVSPPPRLRGAEVWPAGRASARPFALPDQRGHTITLRSLRRQVSVVTFMNTYCTQACPVIGHDLALTQRRLGGSRSQLKIIIIDVNPTRDRVGSMRTFVH